MTTTGASHVLCVLLRVLFTSGRAGENLEARSRLAMLEVPLSSSVVLQAAHDIPAGRA